jgi:hypothetical protein
VIVPILHLLLGLRNDVLDSFWEWVDVCAEKLTLEEVEARQMTMLAELTLDEEVDKLKDGKIALEFLVVLERKSINDNLKTRGLAPADCATLNTDNVGGPKNGSSKSACRASRLYIEQVFIGVNSKSAWRVPRLQSSCTGVHSRTRQRSAMMLTMNYANHRSDGD